MFYFTCNHGFSHCCRKSGADLLTSVMAFSNFFLSGKCHSGITPILFGERHVLLNKESCGIHPTAVIIITPPPVGGRGIVFGRFLSLFLCQQHYEKTAGPICMKFLRKVWSDHRTTWLNFGSIRVNGSAGQRSICLLSPAIAQRTGVNKSVSFARRQQGTGFVVPRTTACY